MNEDKRWIGKNKKALMVVRVSGRGQEHNNSHAYQSEDGKAYAKQVGLELVEVVPIVESAKQSDLRKEYHAAIDKALRLGIRHILFYKVDRESRNLTDNETNEMLVMADKIVLHYVADRKILHKYSPESEFLIRDIQAAQNKHYSRDLGKKIMRATKAKAESGWSPNATPPHGYINEKPRNDKGIERRRGSIVVPDPDQRVVRRVVREFEIRAEPGTPSLRAIRERIIAEGLIAPDKIKKYHTGSIERRLKNIFYDGRFMWDGAEYDGNQERLIPKELFWKVQSTFGMKNPYGKKTPGLFQNGWLKCGNIDCGCHIIFDPRPKVIKSTGEVKIYKHYRCTNGKKIHETTKGMRVTEDQIMEQFGSAVQQISISEDFRDELLIALNHAQDKARRAIKDDIYNFELGLKTLEGREDEVYRDLKSGILDEDGYRRQLQHVRSERSRFTGLLSKAQLNINDVTGETVKSILQLATNAESLWNRRSPEEKRMLLEKLLSNQVLDGATVRYEIIKPLQTLSEMKTDPNWRILEPALHFNKLGFTEASVSQNRNFVM